MADGPWKNIELSKGQIKQKLENLGCVEVKQHTPNSSMWKTPTGNYFSVSYEKCDAAFLANIVAQIIKWSDEQRKY
jgi:hypothetical protein